MDFNEKFLIKLGIYIKEVRDKHNLTQEELCEDICGRSTLAKLELGKIENPSFALIAAICFKLGISIEEIIVKINMEENPGLKNMNHHINVIEEYLLDYRGIDAYEYAKTYLDGATTNYCSQILVICECYKLFNNKKYQEAYEKSSYAINKSLTNHNKIFKDLNRIRIGTFKFRCLVAMKLEENSEAIIERELKIYTEELLDLCRAVINYPVISKTTTFINQVAVLSELCRLFNQHMMAQNLIEFGERLIKDKSDYTSLSEILIAKGLLLIDSHKYKKGLKVLIEAKNFAELLNKVNKANYIESFIVTVKQCIESYQEKYGLKEISEKEEIKS